ncbi:MAG: class I SAM-dependent methyltransferase [Terriglobia bacterium]
MRNDKLMQAEERLREEFNQWAEAGRGEEMAEEHAAIAAGMLAGMEFAPEDKILDLGCGTGWLSAILADKVPRGQVIGIDLSDEMIRQARKRYADHVNLMFNAGSAEDIPWDFDFFNKVVSVESAYYWPEPAQAFREIFRVLRPGGSAHILINLYKENVYAHPWREKLAVPTHLLSGDEWCSLMQTAGFVAPRPARVVDPRPVPEDHRSQWFRSAEEHRKFRREGALLVVGQKPEPQPRLGAESKAAG